MSNKAVIFLIFFLFSFILEAGADTLYLKNGRSIEGLIKKETEEKVELDVGFGTITFRKMEIDRIGKSDSGEIEEIHKKWDAEKQEQELRIKEEKEKQKQRLKEEAATKKVDFAQEGDHIIVNALLNKKVPARFILDTGASTILLSGEIAKRLKLKPEGGENNVQVMLADGSKTDATYVILDTVSVEGLKARNVGAVILTEDTEFDIHDGLLGMSFLNNFNFQIDTVNKKLILKKRR